jgi:glycine betaine/proline transport system permease protein
MSDNPWNTAPAEPAAPADSATQSNAWSQAPATEDTGSSWLDQAGPAEGPEPIDWMHPFQEAVIPLDVWVDQGLNWLVDNFRPVFQAIRTPIDATLGAVEATLMATPDILVILILTGLALMLSGRALAIGTLLSMITIGAIGAWSEAMITLALVLTSVFFCIVIGLPTGIWLSRSERALNIVRPILDAMQTTPAFVYLVPIVMLFGIGNVPGVVVTIIFALPPLIRLTNLGIRQVPEDLVEAARAFGASPRQLLFKVQLPLAMPTIMAGINQTLMLALSMVVIASMIAVGGLGQMVLRGIGRLDMGLAAVGGLGIVLLAIVLDRLTQSMGSSQRERNGNGGLMKRLLGKK